MTITEADDTIPLQNQQQIADCCELFEQAWKTGNQPRMEAYLARVTEPLRQVLLRELLVVELHYRRHSAGVSFDIDRLAEVHPKLMPDIAHEYRRLEDATSKNAPLPERHDQQESSGMTPHVSPGTGSRGLKIKCPHCSNAVELLADTPYDNITCSTCGSVFNLVDREEATQHAPPLKSIGRFELVSRLGVGGFGTVWKARDRELDRTVAVKIPRKGQLAPSEIEQFFREARSAAQLRHPSIVPVHEVGRDGDTIFIVSDLVRGITLSDSMSAGPLMGQEVARLLSMIADALGHAHDRGVVHRDLKPSNILIDDAGNPHLMDFGLAKRDAGEVTMTVDGQVLGTPAYMSPEQVAAEHHRIDRRTDIYSLGVMMFRMLTGELPFRGNAQLQMQKRLNDDAPDPRTLNRFIAKDLATICLKCMERDPDRRYSTAKEVAEELRRFSRGEPIRARPISRIERGIRWARRKPTVATTVGLTILLAVAGPVAAVWIERQRSGLAALVEEKNNLIEQSVREKKSDAEHTARLQNDLDLWLGHANPWEYWPPESDRSPHRAALETVSPNATAALNAELAKGNLTDQQQVYAHLALAMMADRLQRNPVALSHYRSAAKTLAELEVTTKAQPETTRFALARAECYLQMSRITEGDVESSRQHLDDACQILQRLNEDPQVDPRIRVTLVDVELRRLVSSGFEKGSDHLSHAEDVSHLFEQELPSDPRQLYELVCFLTHRDPVILEIAPPPSSE